MPSQYLLIFWLGLTKEQFAIDCMHAYFLLRHIRKFKVSFETLSKEQDVDICCNFQWEQEQGVNFLHWVGSVSDYLQCGW